MGLTLSAIRPGSFKTGQHFLVRGDIVVDDPLHLLNVQGNKEVLKTPADVAEWYWGENPILVLNTGIKAPVPVIAKGETRKQIHSRSGYVMVLPLEHELRSDYLHESLGEQDVIKLREGEHRFSVDRGPKGELNGISSDTGIEIMVFEA